MSWWCAANVPFYLTDLVAHPVRGFAPRGWDQSPHWSILKLDRVKVLMWSATAINLAGVDLIADHQDEDSSASTRNALALLRNDGRPMLARFGDALGELMLFPPAGRWNPLRSMRDGVFRVRMGDQTIWQAPDPAGPRRASKRALDTFDRANGNIDGSTSSDGQFTWTEVTGTGWTVVSNQASHTGDTSVNAQVLSSLVFETDDLDVTMDVITMTRPGGDHEIAAHVRGTSGTTGYEATFTQGAASTDALIYDMVDAVTLSTVSIATNLGALRFTCDGSVLQNFKDGVKLSEVTDTTSAGTNRCGFLSYQNNAGSVQVIDNWVGQDLGFSTLGKRISNFMGQPMLRGPM